jgi:hypothetical protein
MDTWVGDPRYDGRGSQCRHQRRWTLENRLLQGLQAELNATPKHGGSKLGRRKTKTSQRMEDHCMLYADYFYDPPTHAPIDLWQRFRMNKKLCVWGSTKIAPKCLVFHIFIKCGRLWIWYTFLGMRGGTHSDINMLQRVPMFVKLAERHAPKRAYEITSHQYTKWWNGTT